MDRAEIYNSWKYSHVNSPEKRCKTKMMPRDKISKLFIYFDVSLHRGTSSENLDYTAN